MPVSPYTAMKKRISARFNNKAVKKAAEVILAGAILTGGVSAGFALRDYASAAGFATDGIPGVPLTEGEENLAYSIFGDKIDTGVVQKHLYPDPKPNTAATTNTTTQDISFFGPDFNSQDYSQETNADRYSSFVHEMTHVAQIQGMVSTTTCDIYAYTLTPESRLTDFCNEQQASIVEDYSRRFLHPSHSPSFRYISPRGFINDDTPESDALLQKVVEEQFPRARETRLALEAKAQASVKIAQPKAFWRSDLELVIRM